MTDQPVGEGTIARLCEIKASYVDKTLKWYRQRSTWPRVVFRISGTAVIVLSLAVPFVAAHPTMLGGVGLQVASYLIALLSALSSFYGWQTTWQKRISIQLLLEGRIATWQAEIDAAKRMADEEGYARALTATLTLIRSTKILTVGETDEFFPGSSFRRQTWTRKRERTSRAGAGPTTVQSRRRPARIWPRPLDGADPEALAAVEAGNRRLPDSEMDLARIWAKLA
jgi:hypothetical protein